MHEAPPTFASWPGSAGPGQAATGSDGFLYLEMPIGAEGSVPREAAGDVVVRPALRRAQPGIRADALPGGDLVWTP